MFTHKSKPSTPAREDRGVTKAPLSINDQHPLSTPPRLTDSDTVLAGPSPALAESAAQGDNAPVKLEPLQPKAEERRLLVGKGIKLKGEISACDRLHVEGLVEAKLSDSETVVIAEGGHFNGSADVNEAEISGTFEGSLVARKRLVLRATGRIKGNVEYGQLEVERGGQIIGDVARSGDKSTDNIARSAVAS